MRGKNVYLCGPITGTTYDEAALGWRKDVIDALSPHGVECYSPMRGKNTILRKPGETYTPHAYNDNAMATTNGILGRDRYDTTHADLIFCNLLGAKRVSIGSMIEFGWADAHRIPILTAIEKTCPEWMNPHDHLFVLGLSTYLVEKIEDGIYIARTFLVPGV